VTTLETLITNSRPFLAWILEWQAARPTLSLAGLVNQAGAEHIGIVSVDVIKGFCSVGPLASPRINLIIEPIRDLFERAWGLGIRSIALTQDAHPADAVEFNQYAPHCIRGTEESETVDAFRQLPFFDEISLFEKNNINSAFSTGFQAWLTERPQVTTWIVVGDCTDLCTYQLAMHLRLSANQNQREGVQVIAPINAVDTYDLPVTIAQDIGAVPHDGQLLHHIFLYHMMLNGVEIVSSITE
jgi:nicotinamidase-related amidase